MNKERVRHIAMVAAATLVAVIGLHWTLADRFFQKQRADITRQLSLVRTTLEYQIIGSLLVIEGTARYVSMTPGMTQENFKAYAAAALKDKPLLKNLAAAPDLIIRYVYPLAGNEAIMGLDYRTVPGQWPDVQKTMDTGQLTTAGPISLIQGGMGIICRAPVLIEGKPWGIVSSVLDLERLYQAVGIPAGNISLAIRKKGGAPFFGNPDLFLPRSRAVTLPVIIPGSEWEIRATPNQGWAAVSPHILWADLLVVLTGGVLGYWGLVSIRKNQAIQEIRQSLALSQAISHLGSWSLDLNTNTLWWSDETFRILGLDKAQTLPSLDLILSLIPTEDRERVRTALEKAMGEGGEYCLDHAILRKGGENAQVEARGFVRCDPKGIPYQINGTLLDITARKKTEQELRAKEEQMRAMARASHDALIMIDTQDTILFWSDTAEKMFGWSSAEALGKSMHRLITLPQDQKKANEGLKHFAQTGTGPVIGSVTEFDALRKDGSVIPVERSVAAFQLDGAHYAVGSLRDIRDRKEKEARLHTLATTDSLTGLLNRRRFMELISQELKKSQRHQVPFSLVMFDADKFKRINDTFGHDAGDRVLKDLARILRTLMRATDFSGRMGGEEFALGLPMTDIDGAASLAERIREAFECAEVDAGNAGPLHYTASFGVAGCLGDCLGAELLLKQADIALYQAKQKGRNQVAVFFQPPSP